jgi:hypothetical protein
MKLGVEGRLLGPEATMYSLCYLIVRISVTDAIKIADLLQGHCLL